MRTSSRHISANSYRVVIFFAISELFIQIEILILGRKNNQVKAFWGPEKQQLEL